MTFAPSIEDLGMRHLLPEVLNDPQRLEARQFLGALRGRERLEGLNGATRALWPPIAALARSQPTRPVRVLDVGAAAGGSAVRLWKTAARSGLKITVDGCERHPAGLELARQHARAVGAPIRFFAHDVEREPLPPGYDVVTCSLLLHQLDDSHAEALLHRMDCAASELVLVLDLLRCRAGLRYARWTARWLQRSSVVRSDAERALRAAFTIPEAVRLAQRAGVSEAQLERHWPYRFLLSWRPRPRASVAVAE